jgi:hypothetical protein
MALTETGVAALELERVSDKVPALFDRDATFYSMIEKRQVEKVSNRDMRVPLELRPGGNFGHYDPDGGDLGTAGGPSFDKAVINTVHLKHGIQWTKKAEWATDDTRKAVLNTVRHLLAKGMSEFRRNVDSLCMTSGTGILATITSVSTAAGVDTYTLTTDGFGARLLRYGMPIAVMDATLATNRTAGTDTPLTFVDYANKTVKCAAVTGAAATDKIVVGGLGNVTGASVISLLGVPYHHSSAATGSWLGFTRSATPEIRANRVNASAALSLSHARLALNKVADRTGIDNGFKPIACMHPCQQQAYEELGQLASVIQKSAKDESLDLYFGNNMQMAGAPVKIFQSWDKTRIDFIMQSVWGRAEMHPAGFYEVDGRKIFELRGASGGVATSQIFYIVASFNLFVNNPAACSYIDGLTVPTGY